MFDAKHALTGYANALLSSSAMQSRATFERRQSKQVAHWLRHHVPQVDFYADRPMGLAQLPVVQKQDVMQQFEAFNLGRIDAATGWDALHGSGAINGVSVGASTGTSGNRTLYAVTKAERLRWLGAIIGKAIPACMFRPERVAVLLPQSSALYDQARQSRLVDLRFMNLNDDPDIWQAAIKAFQPTTIVAPPRVLRWLAERDTTLAPKRLFSCAETLDPIDRTIIEKRFGLTLGQIYMASEGLFAVSCRHRKLHLAEDANLFEFEDVGDGLVSVIISSFARQFQILARYRMNDILRLSPEPCICGSPLRTVDEVIGRMDDVFIFQRSGADVLITPDIVRNAILNASPAITDFRVERTAHDRLHLKLRHDCPNEAALSAEIALKKVFSQRSIDPEILTSRANLQFEAGAKLRRVKDSTKAGA